MSIAMAAHLATGRCQRRTATVFAEIALDGIAGKRQTSQGQQHKQKEGCNHPPRSPAHRFNLYVHTKSMHKRCVHINYDTRNYFSLRFCPNCNLQLLPFASRHFGYRKLTLRTSILLLWMSICIAKVQHHMMAHHNNALDCIVAVTEQRNLLWSKKNIYWHVICFAYKRTIFYFRSIYRCCVPASRRS